MSALFYRNSNNNDKPSIYYYNNSEDHETRKYYPVNACLQQIASDLINDNRNTRPWEAYYEEGLQSLKVRSFLFTQEKRKTEN